MPYLSGFHHVVYANCRISYHSSMGNYQDKLPKNIARHLKLHTSKVWFSIYSCPVLNTLTESPKCDICTLLMASYGLCL